MEDDSIPTQLTDEQKCAKLKGFNKEVYIFIARKEYVQDMLKIERNDDTPNTETMQKLSEELEGLDRKIKFLEGKVAEFLPCPVALCKHNYKFKSSNKNGKRHAEPILRPPKLTNLNFKTDKESEFTLPKKTAKPVPVESTKLIVPTNNSFAVLNAANNDAEDVPPVAIKPRKGKGKSPNENRKRNEIASAQVKPGLSFAQAAQPIPQHQMATPGNDTSAPNITTPKINFKANVNNKEAANAAKPVVNEEFGILQAIMELQNIFNLFPNLLPQMYKSANSNNPADKLGCLLKGVCSSISTLNINNV
ncbi:hypothetical protein TNCT_396671 [Trichonephila clavata]|uniref:Uncharacterized protein n=1 Tax=Trichonephila clavata TaxID=2740835 RepID=A0A8X6KJT0_TRICU|nr:hypothetical protein TNCT_396671 [Trichonephila clavata]